MHRTPATPAQSSRGKERRGWRDGSLRVFKLFAWLEVGSVKETLSRPTRQPSSGCYATVFPKGDDVASRWAAELEITKT